MPLELGGLLCSKGIQNSTIEINKIKWEKLDKDVVGLVPSGFVVYDTPHQQELFFISTQGSITEEYKRILDQILATFKFLD